MSQSATCPRCQSPLAADAPEGLCPACLMAGGLASAPSHALGSAATTPWTDEKRAAAIADLAPHFPQLEIIELLGQGGMGAVYKARQKHLDRLIALKVIPPEAAKEPAFAERFAREARALARLNHPNIVTVYDFGQSDGVYFLLMEFVDGLNLRQTMQTGNLTPQEALAIVPHICDALQYAHDQGIVHRDVKPENVLLDKSGRVKIADFGLAKLLTHSPLDYTLTHSMQVMGTPRYMAPEQIEHPTEVDHRADIYSLGVMFYEMLTGELPMGRFAPPSQKVQIDIRIDEIVLRTLEKEPARRYQHASDVKTELETVTSSPRPPLAAGASIATLAGDIARVKRQLYWPGIGFVAGGVLGLFFSLYPLFIAAAGVERAFRKQDPWETLVLLLFLLWFAIESAWSMLTLFAGMKFLRMEGYRLSLAGTCLALLPISPASILTIPLGLWGLSILCSRQAREAYRRKELLYASGGGAPSPIPQAASTPSPPLPTWEQTRVRVETPTASFVPLAAKPANSSADLSVDANMEGSELAEIRQQLAAPGMGLMIVGFLGLLPCVLLVLGAIGLFLADLAPSMALRHSPDFAGLDVVPILAQSAATEAAPSMGTPGFAIFWPLLIAVLQVPSSLLMILGGIKMRRLETYGLAVVAGIVALFPTGPAWIISMPMGIWALIVLASPNVREAFRAKRGGQRSTSKTRSPADSAPPPVPAKPVPVDEWKLVNIQQQLFWPGLGLAGGGGLGLVAFAVSCLAAGLFSRFMLWPKGAAADDRAAMVVLLIGLQIPWSLTIMLAGLKMMRVESYGLAIAGAWIALLPIGPAAIVTMPLGIWAIVVLSSSEVREAFRQKAAR